MPFLSKLRTFTKNNWMFVTVVVIPVVRAVWKVIAKPSSPSSSSPTSKRGEVIDVEVTKRKDE